MSTKNGGKIVYFTIFAMFIQKSVHYWCSVHYWYHYPTSPTRGRCSRTRRLQSRPEDPRCDSCRRSLRGTKETALMSSKTANPYRAVFEHVVNVLAPTFRPAFVMTDHEIALYRTIAAVWRQQYTVAFSTTFRL